MVYIWILRTSNKEIDVLHKTLRKKTTIKYSYIYETNDFQKWAEDDIDSFSQGNIMIYKKIVNFFLPLKNIINNLHWYLIAAASNTECIKEDINSSQSVFLSSETINNVPKTENSLIIWRFQNSDKKQLHQNKFMK